MSLPFRNSAVVATAVLVRGNRIRIASVHVENSNASKAYLQFYNAAAAADVTVGTTTPDKTLYVPPNGAMDFDWNPMVEFRLGLVIAATTTATGGDAPGTGLLVNIDYENWG